MIFVISIAFIFVHMIKLRKREDTKISFVLLRAWDKEKVLSSHEESNLRPLDSALRCSTKIKTKTSLTFC